MAEIPRADEHGDDCTMGDLRHDPAPLGSPLDVGRMSVVHCHDCWKYTDDMRREGDLVHEAAAIVINGSTLAVENSEAFKAADAFLAAKF